MNYIIYKNINMSNSKNNVNTSMLHNIMNTCKYLPGP